MRHMSDLHDSGTGPGTPTHVLWLGVGVFEMLGALDSSQRPGSAFS